MSIDWTKVVTPADKFEQARERKRSEIAAARFEAETAGIDVNGFTVRTDRESQALITGAALKAMQDSEYSCRWKGVGVIKTTALSGRAVYFDSGGDKLLKVYMKGGNSFEISNFCVGVLGASI